MTTDTQHQQQRLDPMLIALQRFDDLPTLAEFVEQTEFSRQDVEHQFGSWGEMVEIIDERAPTAEVTETEIVRDMIAALETSDRENYDFRMKDYERLGEYHPRTAVKKFGSWKLAKLAAFNPGGYWRLTGEKAPKR